MPPLQTRPRQGPEPGSVVVLEVRSPTLVDLLKQVAKSVGEKTQFVNHGITWAQLGKLGRLLRVQVAGPVEVEKSTKCSQLMQMPVL